VSGQPNPPLLSAGEAARLLDDVIFTRVAELVDLPRLYDLELMLAHQLEHLGASADGARAGAKEIIDRALLRFARATRTWARWALTPPSSPSEADACEACESAGVLTAEGSRPRS
jgi:hypothetical protein